MLVEDQEQPRKQYASQFKEAANTISRGHDGVLFDLVSCVESVQNAKTAADSLRSNNQNLHLAIIDYYLDDEFGTNVVKHLLTIFPSAYFFFLSAAPQEAVKRLVETITKLPGYESDDTLIRAFDQQLAPMAKTGTPASQTAQIVRRLEGFLMKYAGYVASVVSKPIRHVVMTSDFTVKPRNDKAGRWCLAAVSERFDRWTDDPLRLPNGNDETLDDNEVLWVRYSPSEEMARCAIPSSTGVRKNQPSYHGNFVARKFMPIASYGFHKGKSAAVHIPDMDSAIMFARVWNLMCHWISTATKCGHPADEACNHAVEICNGHKAEIPSDSQNQPDWMKRYFEHWMPTVTRPGNVKLVQKLLDPFVSLLRVVGGTSLFRQAVNPTEGITGGFDANGMFRAKLGDIDVIDPDKALKISP